uniref:40S ribosomal protein S7 n=1 Tax=Syphacia muris TaxID=451379 RepID=A0A0N5ALD0_9BILA
MGFAVKLASNTEAQETTYGRSKEKLSITPNMRSGLYPYFVESTWATTILRLLKSGVSEDAKVVKVKMALRIANAKLKRGEGKPNAQVRLLYTNQLQITGKDSFVFLTSQFFTAECLFLSNFELLWIYSNIFQKAHAQGEMRTSEEI